MMHPMSAVITMFLRFRQTAWVAGAATLLLLGAAAHGRQTPPPSEEAPSIERVGMGEREVSPARPRYLLREGTLLRRLSGEIREEAEGGASFSILGSSDPLAGYRLTLTPGLLLDEVLETLRSMRVERQRFEVTGRVLVYRDRNYLQLTQPAILTERSVDPSAEVSDAAADADEPDSTDSIIRDLERSVGSIPRRVPGGDRDRAEANEAVLPEGTRIVLRRGRLRRTPGGGFLFVFDADASGLADPPMQLIPCMLLENMEQVAMGRDDRSAILLTGTVFLFDGRNYLLPSVYRMPRDVSQLSP